VQLRDDRAKFRRAGARVVLIGLGSAERAAWFCDERAIPFVCTSDPDVTAHRAYGLKRGTLRQVLGPRNYLRWRQLRMLPNLRNQMPKPGEDAMQMPGTFVIDPGGMVRYAHRNRDVSDNPPNDEVLSILQSLRAG
jgi:peroxiredoxin